MQDGMIAVDSGRGKTLGFTSDRFTRFSYLWKTGSGIYISAIESKTKGNFRELVESILSRGLAVKIPTPLGEMTRIVKKSGYIHTIENSPEMGAVEVWVLSPKK